MNRLTESDEIFGASVPLEVAVSKYSHWLFYTITFKRKVFENLQGYNREKPIPMLYLNVQPSDAFASMVAN